MGDGADDLEYMFYTRGTDGVCSSQDLGKRSKHYWYKYFIGECPVCGKDASYKVRMYTPKPADPKERSVYLSDVATYCGCMEG